MRGMAANIGHKRSFGAKGVYVSSSMVLRCPRISGGDVRDRDGLRACGRCDGPGPEETRIRQHRRVLVGGQLRSSMGAPSGQATV